MKVALVTGGARGIGHAIATDLSRDHRVAITWKTTLPENLPAEVLSIQADLTAPDSSSAVIARIIGHFGRLDIIVNNAGLVHPSPTDSFDAASLHAILDVNLLVPNALLAAALPHLAPGSAIVNISSVNAVLPPKGAAVYGASKAALNLWTRAMAKELGDRRIRVNAVAPGAINIPGHRAPRI